MWENAALWYPDAASWHDRRTMDPRHESHGTIVVGTGPGGAAVARGLTQRGESVLMLERGAERPVTGGIAQTLRELGTPGRSVLITGGLLATVRAITTGGSSIYFYGTAYDPPYGVFDRYGIDLRPEVAAIKDELPIGPLADDLRGPKASRIMGAAREIGLDWNPLPKFVDQDQARKGGWLGYYEAPSYESKWNARMWVDDAVAGGARLVTGAHVNRVVIEGGAATGVEYSHGGETVVARAGRVVVAAGGIGTPVVLGRSGFDGVGRNLFYDPLICVMGEAAGVASGPEMPMTAGMHCGDDGYMITDMTVPRSLYSLLAAQMGRVDRLGAYRHTLQIMVKAQDGLSGHLTAGGGVRKRLTRSDRAKLLHGYELAKKVLRAAGARHVFRSWYIASHPGGTVKLGEFVDADLGTRYDNLYVCDASVIPEAWGLPPTLTLLALGRRLAAHLAGERSGAATGG